MRTEPLTSAFTGEIAVESCFESFTETARSMEVIVSVLASDALIERVWTEGATPVLADIDAEAGGMNRGCVEAQIGLDTKRVVVEAEHGSFAPWDGIELATGPREIELELIGAGNVGVWEAVAVGLRGWGKHLVEVDEYLLVGGVGAVVEELRERGVEASPYTGELAFERPQSRLRGRRRDYPGATAWQKKMMVVRDWANVRESLESASRSLARQMSLEFLAPLARRPQREMAAANAERKSA